MTKLQDRKKKEKIKEEKIKTKPYRYTSEGYLSMEIIAMVIKKQIWGNGRKGEKEKQINRTWRSVSSQDEKRWGKETAVLLR